MPLKRKYWWNQAAASTPKMTIRSQLPLPVKLAAALVALSLGGALAIWIFDRGRDITGFNPKASQNQLQSYKEQIEKLTSERDRLATVANAAESTLNIERAAQKQLTQQAKTLEADNMRLKEDLAFFESLLPADTGTRGISIRRVVVDMVAPGQLRYRLLVMQGGKGNVQFDGNVQFSINGQHGGKSVMMLLPDAKSNDADKFKISFKHYQRLEGILAIPEGWIVKTVQARVLEKGQLRTQQSANL